jgi:Starter unit:ACP transacylase in aflatoxin biosynthesis
VSSSHTFLELVDVSIEVLKIAFRVGVQVSAVRDELENGSTAPVSWSAIFPGIGKEEAFKNLADFHMTHVSDPAVSGAGKTVTNAGSKIRVFHQQPQPSYQRLAQMLSQSAALPMFSMILFRLDLSNEAEQCDFPYMALTMLHTCTTMPLWRPF